MSEGNGEKPSARQADLHRVAEALANIQSALAALSTVDLRRYRQVPRVRTLLWDLRRTVKRTETQARDTHDSLADAVEKLDNA